MSSLPLDAVSFWPITPCMSTSDAAFCAAACCNATQGLIWSFRSAHHFLFALLLHANRRVDDLTKWVAGREAFADFLGAIHITPFGVPPLLNHRLALRSSVRQLHTLPSQAGFAPATVQVLWMKSEMWLVSVANLLSLCSAQEPTTQRNGWYL